MWKMPRCLRLSLAVLVVAVLEGAFVKAAVAAEKALVEPEVRAV
jgi:hypothetical protein